MVGSEMGSDRLLDVLGGRSSASRHSPAKRQQMMGSSSSPPPPLAPGEISNCHGGTGDQEGDAGTAVVKLKKKVRASRMQSGENNAAGEGDEGGEALRSLQAATGTGVTARKSLHPRGKVVEDEDSADPAPVPRKLRSAINKRNGQSASPPLPNAKKKRRHVSNGIELHDTITEDEKEVIEALYALSRINATCKIHVEKEGKMISEENLNGNVLSSFLPEVSKEVGFPLECDALPNEETLKGKCSALEKIITNSGSKSSESDVNKIPHPDCHIPILSCKSDPPVCTLGVLPNYYSGNGLLQPSHNVVLQKDSPGTVAVHHDVQAVSDKREPGRKPAVGQKETAVNVPMVPSVVNEHPKLSSSSCTEIWPDTPASRPSLMQTDLPVEFPLLTLSATRSGRNCAIHICISHLIKSYQEKEKETQRLLSFQSDEMKPGELPKLGGISGSEMPKTRHDLSSMTTTGNNCQLVERNTNQARSDMLQNGRYIYSQQPSFLSEAHAGQKQAYQFLSLSTASEASNSGSNMMPSRQLDAPFIQPQFSQHSIVPFPYSHVPYTTPFAEQLPAPANQPVQLRPHYVGNPLYGLQTSSCSDASRLQQQQYQQQQMWQAHLAPGYRQPMSIRMSQNPHLHDPTLSWNLNAQHSFRINPFRRDS